MDNVLSAPGMGYAADAIDARVEFQGRFARSKSTLDLVFFGLFAITVVCFYIIGGLLVSNANFDPRDFSRTQELIDARRECLSRRNLQSSSSSDSNDFFAVLARSPEIPALTMLSVPAFALIFTFLLAYFTRFMVYGSTFLNVAAYIVIGAALIVAAEESSTIGILFVVAGGIMGVLVLVFRSHFNKAARHLQSATIALLHNKGIFLANIVFEIFLLGHIAIFCVFMMFLVGNLEVEEEFCNETLTPFATRSRWFMVYALLWIIAYLNSAKLIATAMVVGGWFFNQDDAPAYASWHAFKAAAFTSCGANALGGLIVAFTQAILERARSRLWWSDPLGCFFKCVTLCLESLIRALTRYAIIAHAFTAEPFMPSASRVFKVLKRNFAGAYITSQVGVTVLNTIAFGCSFGIALVTWNVVDSTNDFITFNQVFGNSDGETNFLVAVAVFLLFFITLSYPLVTIFILTLFFDGVSVSDGAGVLAGLFLGSVARIVLNFQVGVVVDALHTIFLAYAIATEKGLTAGTPPTSDRGIMYALLDDVELKNHDGQGQVPAAQTA